MKKYGWMYDFKQKNTKKIELKDWLLPYTTQNELSMFLNQAGFCFVSFHLLFFPFDFTSHPSVSYNNSIIFTRDDFFPLDMTIDPLFS